MKYKDIVEFLKKFVIFFLVGWFAGDAIRICRGDMRPLTRKGIEFQCITQTRQYELDSIGKMEKQTTLLGFRLTINK